MAGGARRFYDGSGFGGFGVVGSFGSMQQALLCALQRRSIVDRERQAHGAAGGDGDAPRCALNIVVPYKQQIGHGIGC